MNLKTRLRLIAPRPVAQQAYRHMARQYIRSLDVPIDSKKKTVLIINHYFDQDIRALELANREYNLVVVDGPRLFKGGKVLVGSGVQNLSEPYDSETDMNRRRFQRECEIIFDQLRERFDFRLIITAGDLFWWIREFITVARMRGVKTVVLDKEGTRSPYAMTGESCRIRDNAPFISDHIYVWSDRQRRFWNHAGVDDTRITVIGQPRSDLFFRDIPGRLDACFPTVQPLICLFSYEDTAYIPPHLVRDSGLSWSNMKKAAHDDVYRWAQVYPNFNFVIKTHPQQSDLEKLQRRYCRENLAVIGGADVAVELVRRAHLIIAFQTTAVLEAMALGKKIVYTAWDKNYAALADDLIPFHRASGILIADSMDRFRQVCERCLSGDESDFDFSREEIADRVRFAGEYFYRPDGRVCERFFESVAGFIA